jgi:HlyD family secretion protein
MARLAEPGELVAAGRPIATLVNLEELYVRVYVAERDVGRIRLGARATVAVDAYPGRVFAGEVSELAQQAEFTPKEVHMKDEREKLVFGVKLRLANPEGRLKPGMPADAKIRVEPDVGR